MTKKLFVFVTILTIALWVAACGGAAPTAAPTSGGGESADSSSGAAGSEEPLKVILLINGVLGDKSFFDSAQRGVDRAAKELGVEVKTVETEPDNPALWEATLIDVAANEEFDVLIMGTWQMTQYLEQIASDYPDKRFIFFDSNVNYESGCCDNVYSVLYKQNEGSYLAGVYAAAMTTQAMDGMNPEAVIGSVGGQEIPVILDFMMGYEQGAKDINPDIEVIRQFANSWDDPAKGKELTKAQYSQGADIVFPNCRQHRPGGV